ncbi:hypothetical protein SCALIN_C22_0111 [Candidatus Scalindua japonica]|uniref:DUF192 domain-containing protein n=1 Tax=Candidatus Scalindua japonica TaxID=1284222 RepID=A0A286U012_9BACT|nr:DUF192 domain-containing protein [Candidatus Scalindua japonica]GAX61401.1 hypothetical protein SCALIN_C22_0111 [Candidatus Scalindua japonica]
MDSSFRIVRTTYCHIVLLLALFPTITGCSNRAPASNKNTYEIIINDKISHAEVAFTQKGRTIGLMFRDRLDNDHGMLFIYPQEQNLSFWMKNTKIPLSIAFINSKGIITQIDSMTPYSLMSHTSKEKVKYALEMEQGWFRKNEIKAGSKVSFSSEIQYLKVE